ncbi:hypothetical protein B1207_13480 [Legionella quinlivanii]|uniref:Lpg0393-like VPS9-like domain-containing protein n=1 Tax=Legionella quinlivanii TaxID=45073 RepID=A0A364LG29_9GAMM|nr:hypothetical protein [Legionella quinlivanii]RAP35114.1 hypothetical protein B1207_13480 [Legionella quinlivanii]
MTLTTKDYLDFLRDGDYLRALDWTAYLEKKCGVKAGGGDDLLPIGVFELIRYGFCPEDMKHIELLYAAQGVNLFKGVAGYGCTNLISAALQYMVYFKHQLLMFYATNEDWGSNELWDKAAVIKHMERESPHLSAEANSIQLSTEYEALDKRAQELEREVQELKGNSEIQKLRANIESLESYRELCNEYIDLLSKALDSLNSGKTENQTGEQALPSAQSRARKAEVTAVRLGLVKVLNEDFRVSMANKINWNKVGLQLDEIKAQQPLDWEFNYLKRLQPPFSLGKAIVDKQNQLLFFGMNCLQSIIGCDSSSLRASSEGPQS